MEYLGDGTLGIVKKSKDNLQRILQIAAEKLKEQLDNPGQVNPRVLKGVCEEGRFIEDSFCAEYFGGVLSSARSLDGQDDSAISFLTMIKSLSTKQLRLHFIVYSLLATYRFNSNKQNLFDSWQTFELQIPLDQLLDSMEILGMDGECELLLAFKGLMDQGLITKSSSAGILRRKSRSNPFETEVLVVHPNELGARLFLRAMGSRGLTPELIFSINWEFSLSDSNKEAINLPTDAIVLIVPSLDPFVRIQNHFNNRFSEVESSISDLETQLDEFDTN